MAQATGYQNPDLVGKQEDTPFSPSEQQGGGEKKRNVLGKLKDKTKDKTSKLKSKLKPGSGGKESSSSSSSEDEADAPTNNAFSGMTQPEYERKFHSGELSPNLQDADNLKDSQSALGTDEFNRRTPSDFPPSHGQDESSLTKQFEELSTDDKPSFGGDHKFAGSTQTDEGKFDRDSATGTDSILSKAGNPAADDSAVGQEKPDPEGLLSGVEKGPEAPKSWGQWVGEKVGLAKTSSPTSSAETITPGSKTDDKPLTEKIQEQIIGAKDAVVGKTSEATDAAKSKADETKEASATTDPQKQTYTQKLTGAIYGAKDSLMSSTHPGDDEKALSQKVTETVSNLPTTIKSTLGFGKGQAGAATSPTTTPTTGTLDTPVPTEESPSAPPTSPGLVSRITGSVTSLFGKKQPSDSPPASPGQVEDSSTAVPTSETTGTQGATAYIG